MKQLTIYYAKRLCSNFYGFRVKFFLVLAIFSYFSILRLHELDTVSCSAFEYALLAISDHYYITFFFLPVYFTMITILLQGNDSFFLVRSRRFFTSYASKLLAVCVFTLSFVFFHVLIALLIGITKHRLENQFSGNLSLFVSTAGLGALFERMFDTPLIALLCSALYLSLGLCLFVGILLAISQLFSYKVVVMTSVVSYVCIIVVLLRGLDDLFPFLFLNNYIFFHNALHHGIALPLALVSVLCLGLLLLWANRQRAKLLQKLVRLLVPLRHFGESFTFPYCTGMISMLILLSMTMIITFKSFATSGSSFVATTFWGYGLGYFQLIEFLQLLLLNGLSVYLMATYFGTKTSSRSSTLIRYSRKGRWFASLQRSMLRIILLQLGTICFIVFLMGKLYSSVVGGGDIPTEHPGMTALLSNPQAYAGIGLILRTAELMFLQMLFLVLMSITASATTSFLATMGCYFSIVALQYPWIPFGLSSLSRLSVGDGGAFSFNVVWTLVIFVVCYGGMYLYMKRQGIEKLLNTERKSG